MADNNDVLKAIESIKKDMATKSDLATVKKDLQDMKQSQAQTNTALEALAAGQKDQSTKADINRFDLIEERLNLLEGRAGIDSSNVVCTCAYCVKHPFSWARKPHKN